VANASNNVSILLGNGDGTFQPARNFAANFYPVSVAVGDFNGDGIPDLAVANFGSDDVSVLFGNGDGSFQAALNLSVGHYPFSLAVGDFKGDGTLDLAVANYGYGSNTVSVLLGNGDGTFQAARNFPTGRGPHSVVVGDFTGDGVPDLAVANFASNDVSILLGNGDGTFQAPRNFPAGARPYSVAVGDFNGDGHPDLAVANYGGNKVSVLLGNGDGTFLTARDFAAGSGPESVAEGDFTGDGVPDLAVANAASENVSVLLGNGDGTFQAARNYDVGGTPASVAVGDFTGNGILDLAVANREVINGYVSVLLGNGDGTFQPARNFPARNDPIFIAVVDFTGNGILDLAVADAGDPIHGDLGDVSILLGNGDGTFQAARNYPTGTYSDAVAVGDFNSDGVLDLAVANYVSNNVSVLLGNGDGTFQAARNVPAGSHPQSVAVGNFTGNGILDLAVADAGDSNHGDPGNVSILLGNGDGTFQAAHNFPAGSHPLSVAVADFNGDGLLDLVVAGDTVRVLLGRGDGTFESTHVSYIAGFNPTSVAIGDFNGDGSPDLAVANYGSNDVSILLNDGIWPGGPPRPGGGRAYRTVATVAPARFIAEALCPASSAAGAVPALPVPERLRSQDRAPAQSGSQEEVTAETPPWRASPLQHARREGTAERLLDRLFAYSEGGWLWDPSGDLQECVRRSG
jgi:hypothetical protein